MSLLFSPLKLRSITLKNRIVMSPMCQYSATDGFTNNWHLVHIGTRAVGGVGLIIMEATAVQPEGRISPNDLGIWKDEHIAPLLEITTFVKQQNCVAGIQLAHAGRKASTTPPWQGDKYLSAEEGGWQIVGPSEIAYGKEKPTPKAMSIAEIKETVSAFKNAAIRCIKAGFQVIEIHAAHGYLIHEFLSPLSNNRQDEYGGSFENRIRLLKEIVIAVREVWPEELPLFVRISATDWVDGGWNIEESTQLAAILKRCGVDLIDCSSGALVPDAVIPAKPNYQVPFAAAIRKTGIATGAVGIIVSAEQAEKILQDQQADLIFLARELLRNPYFAIQAADELNSYELQPLPPQYERAKRKKKG